MNIALWPRDSIARRFALTVALAVAVTWSLVGLFFVFGGVWAQPSLERSGLLNQAVDMVRIIEAAPPPIREQLASAATTADALRSSTRCRSTPREMPPRGAIVPARADPKSFPAR